MILQLYYFDLTDDNFQNEWDCSNAHGVLVQPGASHTVGNFPCPVHMDTDCHAPISLMQVVLLGVVCHSQFCIVISEHSHMTRA